MVQARRTFGPASGAPLVPRERIAEHEQLIPGAKPPPDVKLVALRQRSAALTADPKASEMQHFLVSHSHQERLLNHATTCAPFVSEAIASRLHWRSEMDRSVRRLLLDPDLALEGDMLEDARHSIRCGHLDEMYDWYRRHGKKEASKERLAPPYVRFERNATPLPGSTWWRPGSKQDARGSAFMAAAAQAVSGRSSPVQPESAAGAWAAQAAAATNAERESVSRRGTPVDGKAPSDSRSLAPEMARAEIMALVASGDVDRAAQLAADELAVVQRENDALGEAYMKLTVAEVTLIRNQTKDVCNLVQDSRNFFAQRHEYAMQAKAIYAMVDAFTFNGQIAEAVEAVRDLFQIVTRTGDVKMEAEVLSLTADLTMVEKELKKMRRSNAEEKRQFINDSVNGGGRIHRRITGLPRQKNVEARPAEAQVRIRTASSTRSSARSARSARMASKVAGPFVAGSTLGSKRAVSSRVVRARP